MNTNLNHRTDCKILVSGWYWPSYVLLLSLFGRYTWAAWRWPFVFETFCRNNY